MPKSFHFIKLSVDKMPFSKLLAVANHFYCPLTSANNINAEGAIGNVSPISHLRR